MAWYLYILGIFVMLTLIASANVNIEEKMHPLFGTVISLIWPVSFPALLTWALLSAVIEVVDERKEHDADAGSDKGD